MWCDTKIKIKINKKADGEGQLENVWEMCEVCERENLVETFGEKSVLAHIDSSQIKNWLQNGLR